MQQPSETFEKAIALIKERGWCQGKMVGPNGELCADGALWHAARVEGDSLHDYLIYDAARMTARGLIQARLGGEFLGLMSYNDVSGRTKEEVLGMLRWMAEQARAEGK